MKIGIHYTKTSFSDRWIEYCIANDIKYKLVDCYKTDIIQQLSDCDALMWHFSHFSAKDFLFAKELIFSVEADGKKVFPDFCTAWHFDDKLGQKYLLEAIGAPLVPTWIFYDKDTAIQWLSRTDLPKVFKLREGAGSQNVKLVRSRGQARRLICRAFGRGFPVYDNIGYMKEWRHKYRLGKSNLMDLSKEIIRFIFPAPYARIKGREKGYIYFQEYIPGNAFDIRIIIVGEKAFGIKRMVRKNDFRASGSGMVLYEREHFNDETVRLSFQMADKLKSQCAAFDFIYSGTRIYVTEVSYGFIKEVYDPCTGYWDKDLNWYEGKFNPYGWMVDNLIKEVEEKKGSRRY
jgi:glutathione synthase/RimK-type ligase-like ATP-grasp enzyme